MPANEAREWVAAGVYAHCQESYAAAWVNEPDECKSADLEIADAAISAYNAWLWEQAERPEVVEAVGKIGLIGTTRREMERILTALIGPKPEVTNDDN